MIISYPFRYTLCVTYKGFSMKLKELSLGKPSKRQVDELFLTLDDARDKGIKKFRVSDDSGEANGRARQTQH